MCKPNPIYCIVCHQEKPRDGFTFVTKNGQIVKPNQAAESWPVCPACWEKEGQNPTAVLSHLLNPF